MTKMPGLSGREVTAALSRLGFEAAGRKGSHIRMRRRLPEGTRIVVVPDHQELAPGTLAAIRRQAGLSREEFLDLF